MSSVFNSEVSTTVEDDGFSVVTADGLRGEWDWHVEHEVREFEPYEKIWDECRSECLPFPNLGGKSIKYGCEEWCQAWFDDLKGEELEKSVRNFALLEPKMRRMWLEAGHLWEMRELDNEAEKRKETDEAMGFWVLGRLVERMKEDPRAYGFMHRPLLDVPFKPLWKNSYELLANSMRVLPLYVTASWLIGCILNKRGQKDSSRFFRREVGEDNEFTKQVGEVITEAVEQIVEMYGEFSLFTASLNLQWFLLAWERSFVVHPFAGYSMMHKTGQFTDWYELGLKRYCSEKSYIALKGLPVRLKPLFACLYRDYAF